MTISEQELKNRLPFRSAAVALLFSVFLGPIGLLYASVRAGIIMMIVGFVVVSSKFMVPIILVWMISCAWSVSATNQYNEKLLKQMKI